MTHGSDPLLGRTIADRYEIVSTLNVGGMGTVYRAIQRSLDRVVAIKFIQRHLLGFDSSIQRFMTEARILSRMSHPHVVSVFDFGRTPESEGGHLFLVMEYLTGRDLGEVLAREPFLALPRVASIVLQTLEGLGEAHHLGIVHRDVKPENIILVPTRGGRDHVKIIDFGIALAEPAPPSSEDAAVCGTPHYMAPEQGEGTATPSSDLYSVGVMLFQMLAGGLPADRGGRGGGGEMRPRLPDPRYLAPHRGIPDAIAQVCVRALELDPAQRFPSAEAFDEALRGALARAGLADPPSWDRSSWPPRNRRSVPPEAPRTPKPQGTPKPQEPRVLPSDTVPSQRPSGPPPFVGRAAELAWAREILSGARVPSAIALWGRSGVGRTRLAREVAAAAEREATLVVPVELDPQPYGEVGYRGLRRMIQSLSGRSPVELLDDRAADRWALAGLRLLFSRSQVSVYPAVARRAAAAALAWGMWRATVRAERGRVLLVLDDLDRLDGASLLALQDHLQGDPVPGVTALVTSEDAKTVFLHGARERALRGLSREEATGMLASLRQPAVLYRSDDDIEPLYVEQVAAAKAADAYLLPETLESLVEWHAQSLTLVQRRIVQAIAIVGVYDVDHLGALLRLAGDMRALLAPLVERGWLSTRGRQVTLRNTVLGRVAGTGAPAGTAVAVHKAAAHRLRNSRDLLELRAFHAIHGAADFEAFLLLEEVARLRSARGDGEGAIAALSTALAAGRVQVMRGEAEAASTALGVFGRKLAAALVAAGRPDEAQGVLDEVLDTSEPKDATRAAVLAQLATVAELRGHIEETDRRRREALEIAERSGDQQLTEKLKAALAAGHPPLIKTAGPQSFGMGAPPPEAAAERPRRSVLVVEDDSSIREGIQSAVESEGFQAYGAANGRDALDVLHRIPRPGLILLDLMMPVMSGWELLDSLRADDELAQIPVVIVSAVPDRNKLGASRVLRKPVEVNTLLNVVEEFCN
jgi:serine/threonine protein kinase/CheY-like chemotaxis protein